MHIPAELTHRMKTVAVLVALLFGARESGAQSLSVSGSPSLRVQVAVAGSPPTTATHTGTTYTVNVGNKTNQKITARISAAMPTGLTLTVDLVPPSGATDAGTVTLTTVSQDLVTAIPKNTNTTKSITYTLRATAAAGVVSSGNRIVTFTVLTGA